MKLYPIKPSRRATVYGGIYLILYMCIIPWLLPLILRLLVPGIDAAQANFVFFCVNFAATTVIFGRFLLDSLDVALQLPKRTIFSAILGYLGSMTLGSLVVTFILNVYPDYANVNNANISGLVQQNYGLMALGVVFLGPVTEELLFRGLIFRNLYDRSPLAAHLVTMCLFSAIHVSGYIGVYEPVLLLLCFIQYLPAAYCLNFAYLYSGTIVGPILMHILTNCVALSLMR